MFGYILPEKPELKIKEYEVFRAYYCGVCKSIGKRYGQLQRMILNYDTTFLAILLSSLSEEGLTIKQERCIAHPVKKRSVIRNNNFVDYAADMNVILAYYNLKDNWVDDHSIPSAAVMGLLKRSFNKLRRKYNNKCEMMENRLRDLSALEKERCDSMDAAAEPFAKLMEEVTAFEPLCTDSRREKVLRWIGYNLGKWVYLLDAFDDIQKDIDKKAYNPLLAQFQCDREDAAAFRDRIRERVEFTLTYCLQEIAKAYELLETKTSASIVENIIYMGMLRKTENILNAGRCRKIEKSL